MSDITKKANRFCDCINVEGSIKWHKQLGPKAHTHYFQGERELSRDEVLFHLRLHRDQGHVVIPMNGMCDNWDYTTGCNGHHTEVVVVKYPRKKPAPF